MSPAAPPPLAARVFGPRLALAVRYAELLAGPGIERGLLGPREVERVWERHLLNCAALSRLIPDGARVADLGSGAGLPGLVLAIQRPDLEVTLLEPMLRRSVFLEEAVTSLGLPNAHPLRARAEDVDASLAVDVVVVRAVAPLARLVTLAAPLLASGGLLLALKGTSAAAELAAAQPVLQEWAARDAEVVEVGDDQTWPRATVIRVGLPASARAHVARAARRPAGRQRRDST
jgi:16S rRNA (guanine527-N7)-methyltransferase